jgi:hypothetical protein
LISHALGAGVDGEEDECHDKGADDGLDGILRDPPDQALAVISKSHGKLEK